MGLCRVCGTPLTGRQKTACSNRHRAELSRREREAKARAPFQQTLRRVAGLLEEANQEIREVLKGTGEEE